MTRQLRPGNRITRANISYPEPLPPHTMVRRSTDGAIGEVQPYHPDALPARLGTFPIRWHGGRWGTFGANDVTPLIPTSRA